MYQINTVHYNDVLYCTMQHLTHIAAYVFIIMCTTCTHNVILRY